MSNCCNKSSVNGVWIPFLDGDVHVYYENDIDLNRIIIGKHDTKNATLPSIAIGLNKDGTATIQTVDGDKHKIATIPSVAVAAWINELLQKADDYIKTT